MVLGKFLGALIGFALGLGLHSVAAGVLLAVFGAFLGHMYDSAHAPPPEPLPPELTGHDDVRPRAREPAPRALVGADEDTPDFKSRPELEAVARAQFARRLCELFVEVARADGEVVGEEVRVVRQFFEEDLQFAPSELDLVRKSLKAAIADPEPLDQVVARARQELSGAERQLLLNALYELALADGNIKRSESEAIKRVARGLELDEEELRSIAALHLGHGHSHYAALGLNAECSDEELRSAFRRLASTHHPDKVAHLGPRATELASRRFQEIKDAYEELRRIRGL